MRKPFKKGKPENTEDLELIRPGNLQDVIAPAGLQ